MLVPLLLSLLIGGGGLFVWWALGRLNAPLIRNDPAAPSLLQVRKGKKSVHVAVIGAGPCGVVSIKEMIECGHTVTCYEQSDNVGGMFAKVYSDGQMVSSLPVTAFSDFMHQPHSMEEWDATHRPTIYTFKAYVNYLREYCAHFGLFQFIKFQHSVREVQETADGRFEVRFVDQTKSGGKVESQSFDRIVFANSNFKEGRMPQYPGFESFKGEIKHLLHVSEFAEFKGKRMLVVG
jgi:cation diffusion facilitator CzcD-associated flavoprotein CzcO